MVRVHRLSVKGAWKMAGCGVDYGGLVIGAALIFAGGIVAGLRIGWALWRRTYITGSIEPMRRRWL
jgi:hypothetical protein